MSVAAVDPVSLAAAVVPQDAPLQAEPAVLAVSAPTTAVEVATEPVAAAAAAVKAEPTAAAVPLVAPAVQAAPVVTMSKSARAWAAFAEANPFNPI